MKQVLTVFLTIMLSLLLSSCVKQPQKKDYCITHQQISLYKDEGITQINTLWAVENQGKAPLYLRAVSCDLQDENGVYLGRVSPVFVYPQVINAGETAYYYAFAPIEKSLEKTTVFADFKVDAREALVPTVRLKTEDVKLFKMEHGAIKAEGILKNNTDKTQEQVQIAVVLFDEKNMPIHVLTGNVLEKLSAGTSIPFVALEWAMPSDFGLEDIYRFEVFAYPVQRQ